MTTEQYFAQLDENNEVIYIAIVTSQFMAENPDRYPGTWVECFIDSPTKTYPGTGFTYNETIKDFVPPTPPEPMETL